MTTSGYTVSYLVGRIATGLIGLVSLAVFTRILTTEEYGYYAVLIAAAGLLSAVVFQWLRHGLLRFGVHEPKARRGLLATIGATFWMLVCLSACVAAIAWILFFPTNHMAVMILLVCTVGWAQAWFEFALDAARIDFKPVRYGTVAGVRALLCLAFGAAGAIWFGGVEPLVAGVALGYFLSGFLPAPWILPAFVRFSGASVAQFRVLSSYGFPLSLTLGSVFVLDSSDRLILASMTTVSEVGLYAAAYNLAQFALGTLVQGLTLGAYPLAVKVLESQGDHAVSMLLERYAMLVFALGLPAVVGLALEARALGPLVIGIFDPEISATIIGIVSIGIFLGAFRSHGLDTVLMLKGRTGLQSTLVMLAAAINVALNLLLIPGWGVIGAAWATLITFALAAIASFLMGRRLIPIRVSVMAFTKLVVATSVMSAPLIFWPPVPTWPSVLVKTISSGVLYGAALVALFPQQARALFSRFVRLHR